MTNELVAKGDAVAWLLTKPHQKWDALGYHRIDEWEILTRIERDKEEVDFLTKNFEWHAEPLYAADNPAIKALVDCLKECADDLEGELKARYPDSILTYPGERKKYERDMAPVIAARAALATLAALAPWVKEKV